MSSNLWRLQTFDPEANFSIVDRKLPHWSQAGTVCFITWRTFDSLPSTVLQRWHAERDEWLCRHGIDPRSNDWREQLQECGLSIRSDFTKTFSKRWHRNLDEGHGDCILRQPNVSKIVADSLMHFDGKRYEMIDFVVMPNHVHLLASFVNENGMLRQCDSWKHFTAHKLNVLLGRSGRFWQQDGFDHLVRTAAHFDAFRRYIAGNPQKAGLKVGEYLHYSKDL